MLHKFVLHLITVITSSQTSLIGLKKIQIGRLITFYLVNFTLRRIPLKKSSCVLLKFLLHVPNNQLSDKFNNGDMLLLSVLLFFFVIL